LKNRVNLFLVCLIFVVMGVAWDIGHDAHAQSYPNMAPQLGQEGQATLVKHDESSILKTPKDQVNYAIGVSLISNFKKQGVDIDLNMVIKGMQDAHSGEKLLLSDGELQNAMLQYYAGFRQMQAKVTSMTAEENKKEGEVFLSENSKKEGVITLPSSLQYRIIKVGDGKKPIETDTVECHYRGTFINGNEFDNSYRTGKPETFKVDGVIPGWKEALMLMPVGSKWQIFIPSQLAYGERGAGSVIGPNATLIFEIELLAIK
jgi:FKBP-type peptidyl-prolyl cis-trans isomerase